MEVWALVLIIGLIVAATAAFIWLGLNLKLHQTASDYIAGNAGNNTQQVFTPEFIEELRNKARRDFDELVKTHAAQLNQQLSQAVSELDKPLNQQVEGLVQQQLADHQDVINSSRQSVALASLASKEALEHHGKTVKQSVEHDLQQLKQQRIEHFEQNMAEIINHYLLAAIGHQADSKDQIAQIISELEAHKAQMVQDIKHD